MDKKQMTDEKIEKGLECCGHYFSEPRGEDKERWCNECPYNIGSEITCAGEQLPLHALAHINRQKDRIAELEVEKAVSDRALELLRRAEPIRVNSFIERAKQELEKEKANAKNKG